MTTAGDILKNKSVQELVKEARAQSGSRLSPEQEKRVKDIGGVIIPAAFQVPNEIIDEGWLAELSGAELKILIFIIRKTFGFNKVPGDRIPVSQIVKATGLSKQGVLEATSVLEKCGLIRVKRGKGSNGERLTNFYQLITRADYNHPKIYHGQLS